MEDARCAHPAWISVVGGKSESAIQYGHRFRRLVEKLDSPQTKTPSLVFFMGRQNKDAALRQLYPQNVIRRHRLPEETVNLNFDESTLEGDFPILFADCDPTLPVVQYDLSNALCHYSQVHPLRWSSVRRADVLDTVIARLLLPCADVICIFTEDLGGPERVEAYLHFWGREAARFTTNPGTRPSVILVEQETSSLQKLSRSAIPAEESLFAEIKVVTCLGARMHQNLRSHILDGIQQSRSSRRVRRFLFSGAHQSRLFEKALEHVARTLDEPFDVVLASRADNPIKLEEACHIENVLRIGRLQNVDRRSLASFVASNLLVDAYPPGMHVFPPDVVFTTLYKPLCLCAAQAVFKSGSDAVMMCMEVEKSFTFLWQKMSSGNEPAMQIHRVNVDGLKVDWSKFFTNKTCLACIRCPPEHVMPCGHSICDNSVRKAGVGMVGFEDKYVVNACPICRSKQPLVANLKPKSAGIRILSLDGGGSRGIVALKLLGLVQDMIGPDLAIQDFFDFIIGSSAGGLIALGLSKQRWNVKHATQVFKLMTKRVFGRSQRPNESISQTIARIFKGWVSDSMCDVAVLEEVLIEQFGPDQRLFDNPFMVPSGSKVAVTAATTSRKSSTSVLANYNGLLPRAQDSGYRLERPLEVDQELRVWQAARATSAAPVLFRPARISPFGTFQDSLRNNNPVNVALWECKHIWPSISRPDVVLSVGTGKAASPTSPQGMSLRNFFKDTSAQRLWRLLEDGIDADVIWRDLWNRLDSQERQDYIRMTLKLPQGAAAVNSAEFLDILVNHVRLEPQGPQQRLETFDMLMVSSFYFVLDQKRYKAGLWSCHGSVRCRFGGYALIRTVRKHFGDAEFYVGQQSLGCKVEEQDVCQMCYRYRRPVQFHVGSLDEPFAISLHWGDSKSRKISAMPETVAWFVEEQQMETPFGTPDHGDANAVSCSHCSPPLCRQ